MQPAPLLSLPWWLSIHHRWQKKRYAGTEFASLFDTPPDKEWVSLDCETIGLNVKSDHLLSIGAVRIAGQRILSSERLEMIIQPPRDIPVESIRVHRLREADVADGLPIEEAMRRLLAFIGSRPLVGYYLEFDVAMINRALKPLFGFKLPQAQIEVSALYYDYKFRQLPPYQQYDNADIDLRFNTLMADLELPTRDAHDALNDAVMAALAFIKLRSQAATT